MNQPTDEPSLRAATVFAGGGAMGKAMRALDWAATPLGPVAGWPASLRTVVRLMLDSRYAMWLAWGPQLTFFCNDAYRPTLGIKRGFLGAPAEKVWAEIWSEVGPRIEHVLATGEATWDSGLMLFLKRSGFVEETYHSFSYSPVRGDDGAIAGMLCVVSEDTERVIGERRVATLAALSLAAGPALAAEAACRQPAGALARADHDLPFTAIYLLDDAGHTARRVAATGMAGDEPALPVEVDLRADGADAGASIWPFADLLGPGTAARDVDLTPLPDGGVRAGPWPEPIARGLVLSLPQPGAAQQPAGFLVAGLSTRLAVDDSYRRFVALVAAQITTLVSDARALEAEQQRAQALAEIDRAKTVFFSNVSHELRTPLTLMLAPIAELLEPPARRAPDDGDARELLKLAQRNGERLLRLVNTLLDFSRIEAGRMRARYEPVDLAACTAELASVFRSALEHAGLALIVDCPPLEEPVFVDREMWEKIVLNLLSNAYKFTFEGGVRVSLRSDGDCAILTVADTGTGIPVEAMSRLFERFYRAEGTHGRSTEGSGIGLALVQELARLHGGDVSVQSTFGAGSHFIVRVKLGRAHLPAEQVVIQPAPAAPRDIEPLAYIGETLPEPEVTDWGALGDEAAYARPTLDETDDAGQPHATTRTDEDGVPHAATRYSGEAAPHATAGARSEEATDARPLLLLADDNADMRAYVQRLLGPDYRILAVADGSAALRAARTHRPDLLLSDVMMPGLDGFALLREVRADAGLSAMPVILLSARAGAEARIEGIEAGADDYIVKPFHARELQARVGGALALARLRGEAAATESALRDELEQVLANIADGFIVVDADWRYTYVNAAAERLTRHTREQLLGTSLWDFPGARGSALEATYRRAMAERIALTVDAPYEPLDTWFEVHVYPTPSGGLAFSFRDVKDSRLMERVLRESDESQRFQLALGEALRGVGGEAEAAMTTAARLLCEQLGANRCAYAEIEPDGEHVRVLAEHARSALPGLQHRRHRLADYGADVLAALRGGEPRVLEDARADSRLLDAQRQAYAHVGVRADLAMPLRNDGRLVAALAVHQTEPRRWTPAEIELARITVDRAWHAVQTARAEAARAAGEQALRASEQRFRGLADALPTIVFATAPDGAMHWINQFGLDYLGVAEERVLGNRRFELIHPDDRDRMRGCWREALESGAPYEAQMRVRCADGRWCWVLSRALPLRDAAGRITEWIGGAVDIDELRRAQQVLKDADRRKDEFIATLAHELRNPLAPLRSAAYLLEISPSTETAQRVEPMMRRQIDHLVRLVDDLLEVSRIAGGRIELQRAPLPLAGVLAAAVEASQPLIEAGGHTLRLAIDDENLWLDGDAVRLTQVFANLLNNAAKYTDTGGTIELAARREGNQAVVSVTDNGAGIEPHLLQRVFELFMQVERSSPRAQGGLGLGLALVQSLVAQHGGSVEAISEGLGRGTCFTVRLPLLPAPPADAPHAASNTTAPAASPRQRVLVVDDNVDAAQSLGALLECLGACVRVVHDGQAALEAVAAQTLDVALLDIGMPGMDGHELARRLRAMPQGQDLTLIALTGWGQPQDRERSQASGFDHHMVKPADVDELLRLLQRAADRDTAEAAKG